MAIDYRIYEGDRDALARKLEQERRELNNAPVVKIVTDAVLRCHLCGAVSDQLYEIETIGDKVEGIERGNQRLGCAHCHPEAREELWKMRGKYTG